MVAESRRARESSRTRHDSGYECTGYRSSQLRIGRDSVSKRRAAQYDESCQRTVDGLARLDNLAKRHPFRAGFLEARQDTRSKLKLLVEVTLRPPVVLDSQFGRHVVVEVGSIDAERVQVGDVVTTNLEGTYEKLYLQKMVDCILIERRHSVQPRIDDEEHQKLRGTDRKAVSDSC